MNVQYWQPLEDAIRRTRVLLLQPLNLGRWFVMGFTVWLIHIGRTGSSVVSRSPEFRHDIADGEFADAMVHITDAATDIMPTGIALALWLTLITGAVIIGLVLLWIGSRARFVWLENLHRRDHVIGAYWSQHGRLGDSFFLWKIGFVLVVVAVVLPLAMFTGVLGALTNEVISAPAGLLGWVLMGAFGFAVTIVLLYVDFFAESFVTVIMHRRGIGVLPAWREFLRLFQARPGPFVLVGLVKVLLHIAAAMVVVLLGLATCCVGLMLAWLPYIGTVITLPLLAALRYYDLCWFSQFGPDFALLDEVPPTVPEPPVLALPTADTADTADGEPAVSDEPATPDEPTISDEPAISDEPKRDSDPTP